MLKKWRNRTQTKNAQSKTTGDIVEAAATQWLKTQGLILVTYNYRCRAGEIDIIMRDGKQLVFVEVRFRKHCAYGDGVESVDWRKQKKLQRAAEHYLLTHPQNKDESCRFDVIGAKLKKQGQTGNGHSQPSTNNAKLQSIITEFKVLDPKRLEWLWIKNAF